MNWDVDSSKPLVSSLEGDFIVINCTVRQTELSIWIVQPLEKDVLTKYFDEFFGYFQSWQDNKVLETNEYKTNNIYSTKYLNCSKANVFG